MSCVLLTFGLVALRWWFLASTSARDRLRPVRCRYPEIGGGYLVRLWLRNDRSVLLGALSGLLLCLYGVLPTMQPAGFDSRRVYAAWWRVRRMARGCAVQARDEA